MSFLYKLAQMLGLAKRDSTVDPLAQTSSPVQPRYPQFFPTPLQHPYYQFYTHPYPKNYPPIFPPSVAGLHPLSETGAPNPYLFQTWQPGFGMPQPQNHFYPGCMLFSLCVRHTGLLNTPISLQSCCTP